MIERLTERSPKNNMAYLAGVKADEQGLEGSYNTLMCVRDAFEQLAKYEDSGLSPQEVEQLNKINIDLCDSLNTTEDARLRRSVEIVAQAQEIEQLKSQTKLMREALNCLKKWDGVHISAGVCVACSKMDNCDECLFDKALQEGEGC